MDSKYRISSDLDISGSLTISQSLIVSQSITAISFIGDGSGLTYVTASIAWDGSRNGNAAITGSLTVSGSNSTSSIDILGNVSTTGFIKLKPTSQNLTVDGVSAYIYVSSSTDDLYFTQNQNGLENTVRLRWLEGNLYSGLLNGGIISATTGSTTFNISSGSGIIVNLNASLSDDPYPTVKYVNWVIRLIYL